MHALQKNDDNLLFAYRFVSLLLSLLSKVLSCGAHLKRLSYEIVRTTVSLMLFAHVLDQSKGAECNKSSMDMDIYQLSVSRTRCFRLCTTRPFTQVFLIAS